MSACKHFSSALFNQREREFNIIDFVRAAVSRVSHAEPDQGQKLL